MIFGFDCYSLLKKDTDQIRSEGAKPHVTFGKAMLDFLGAQVEGNTTIKFDLSTTSNVVDRTKILEAAVLNLSQAVSATS